MEVKGDMEKSQKECAIQGKADTDCKVEGKKEISQQILTGERALFQGNGLTITDCVFMEGESPLKESQDIVLNGSLFRWKYPLWYSKNIVAKDCVWFDMARAGVWYTDNILVEDSVIEAPKNFRRCHKVKLKNVSFPNAAETLWNCENIKMEHVTAKGEYFAMNSQEIEIDGFTLTGDYSFDGAKNVVIKNARMLSKDSFWNTENVKIGRAHV